MENYNEKAEKNLLDMVNREQKANEKMMFYGYTVGGLSVASFLIIILLVAFVIENLYLQILLSTVAVIILMLDMLIGVKIESEAGYYECAKCHEKYVPKYVDAFFAMHIGTTRYLKCPHCQKYSWSKKVLTK